MDSISAEIVSLSTETVGTEVATLKGDDRWASWMNKTKQLSSVLSVLQSWILSVWHDSIFERFI